MNSLCPVLAISLAVFLSEACIFTPPPPTPTTPKVTTTKAPSPTTTKPTKYECPIGGETDKGTTCVGSQNVLSPDGIVSANNPIECNKKCTDYKDSKCKFWSFVPTRKICFLLSSCVRTPEPGVLSGEKGCIVPSKEFTIFNLINKELTDCKAKWEPTDICPEQNVGTDAKTTIAPFGKSKVLYFAAPPSIGCTKITAISCNFGAEKCEYDANKLPINVPIPNLYVKTKLADPTKCEIANTPKYALG